MVDSPHGRQIRVGIVPTDDATKWRAGNRGGTVNLKPRDVAHLRDDLEAADKTAKAAAAKADKEWASGGHPDLREAVAEGSVSSEWGDLRWSTYLTDDDPTSWTTSLEAGGLDSVYEPGDLRKLLRTLDDITKTGA